MGSTPIYDHNHVQIYHGCCLDILPTLPERSVHCCVTSPPYYGLRSYLPDAVRLRNNLSPAELARVLSELERRGIFPVDHSTD